MNYAVGSEMVVACRGEQWYVLKPDGHEVLCASAHAATEKAKFLQEAARLYELWMARNVPMTSREEVTAAVVNAADLGVTLSNVGQEVHFNMNGCCGYVELDYADKQDGWEVWLIGHTTFVGRATTENELRGLFEKAPLMYNKACHAAREERDPRALYFPLTWSNEFQAHDYGPRGDSTQESAKAFAEAVLR